ncbi:hypothetical protein D3C87_1946090 [compost metagenome]
MNVTAKEFVSKKRSLVTTSTRTDLQNDVLIIIRIFGNEENFKLMFKLWNDSFEFFDLFTNELAHFCILL